jgi:hypothetical protein
VQQFSHTHATKRSANPHLRQGGLRDYTYGQEEGSQSAVPVLPPLFPDGHELAEPEDLGDMFALDLKELDHELEMLTCLPETRRRRETLARKEQQSADARLSQSSRISLPSRYGYVKAIVEEKVIHSQGLDGSAHSKGKKSLAVRRHIQQKMGEIDNALDVMKQEAARNDGDVFDVEPKVRKEVSFSPRDKNTRQTVIFRRMDKAIHKAKGQLSIAH